MSFNRTNKISIENLKQLKQRIISSISMKQEGETWNYKRQWHSDEEFLTLPNEKCAAIRYNINFSPQRNAKLTSTETA